MRRLALAALLLLGSVAIVDATGPALAHAPDRAASAPLGLAVDTWVQNPAPAGGSPADPVVTATQTSSVPTWLALLVLAAVLVGVVWSRRATAGLLIVLLAVFVFETGLHSVHHLGEKRDAPRCVIESAASHLGGVVGGPMSLEGPGETAELPPCLEPATPPRPSLHPDRGRAPPFLA